MPPAFPEVDDPRVALALEQVRNLDERPLSEHHDRLAGAHEVLHTVLHAEPTTR